MKRGNVLFLCNHKTMETNCPSNNTDRKMSSPFERYLTVWVGLCIVGGIAARQARARAWRKTLDGMAIYVNGAPVVSIPIAICLFFMMYPIMVKIDFASVDPGRQERQAGLADAVRQLGDQAVHHVCHRLLLPRVRLPRRSSAPRRWTWSRCRSGSTCPSARSMARAPWCCIEGVKMLQVPLWRSYLAGCILLGIAPCTAMVLVWGYLARGNDGLTLVMVAINSLTMLVLYGVLGGFLLGVGRLPVPWQALLLSIGIYVALPLVAGYFSRKWIIAAKGEEWFKEKFLHVLTPVTIIALLTTLVLLFSFKGEVILANPLTILWIAIPLFLQTMLIFGLGYGLATAAEAVLRATPRRPP